jgi:hypothetical protein
LFVVKIENKNDSFLKDIRTIRWLNEFYYYVHRIFIIRRWSINNAELSDNYYSTTQVRLWSWREIWATCLIACNTWLKNTFFNYNSIFLYKSDYHKKIEEFIGPNFEKIDHYDNKKLEIDLENYRELIIYTLRYSLPKCIIKLLHPPSYFSELYGTIKFHKQGYSIRGIYTL